MSDEVKQPETDTVKTPEADAAKTTDSTNIEPSGEEKKVSIPRPAIKIGSQREGAKPVRAKAQPGLEGSEEENIPAASFPPPRPPAKMSEELELEIAAALGESSIDDIMSAGSPSTAGSMLEEESRHQARVVSLRGDDIFVELGSDNQGVVSAKQLSEPPEPGTMIEVQVTRFNNEDGLYELTIPGSAADISGWEQVSEGMIVEAVVTGHNKGGLECQVNRLRGFMPVSQISLYRVEDLEPFVGQKFDCVITEADVERQNLVLSRRGILEREQAKEKEKLLATLAIGQQLDGVVSRLQPFGAFVDLGGVDGLIHISQMSWDRVNDPSEILEEGQKVSVKVVRIDAESGKIGLSYREQFENPWQSVTEKYRPKQNVEGTVVKLMDFGAFVKLEPGIEGLVHISELAHQRVHRVSDVLSEGQEIEVQVISVDTDSQRISLSLKALQARPAGKSKDKVADEDVLLESPPLPKNTSNAPLKGGTGGASGGEEFGLNW